jgi:hypothetical protein
MSDSDIVKDFLIESYVNLDGLDRDLVGLESSEQTVKCLGKKISSLQMKKIDCNLGGNTIIGYFLNRTRKD